MRRLFLILFTSLALTACGFALRKTPTFSFTHLYSGFSSGSAVGTIFNKQLKRSSSVDVITDPKRRDSAEVLLDILQEQQEQVVVGISTAGQVREYQLRLRLQFRVRDQYGRDLIETTELLQQRDISNNESTTLSEEGEIGLLYHDMQVSIAQQLMRRLATVKLLPPPQ